MRKWLQMITEGNKPAVEANALGATDEWPRNELLATYLEPRFGNIYEYDVEPQRWTDALRDAVTDYLMHSIPDDVAAELFTELDADGLHNEAARRKEVEAITGHGSEPWEVAFAVRNAAVAAVPTLDELIGHLDAWPGEDERNDAMEWLDVRVNDEQLRGMTLQLDRRPNATTRRKSSFVSTSDLTHDFEPGELLASWHKALGITPSDLTDDEWRLLVQALPPDTPGMKTTMGRGSTRREFDGMLYRYHEQTPWQQIPQRYGSPFSIQARRARYKTSGVFALALTALDGNPKATRLIEWPRTIVGDEQANRQ